LTIPRTKVLALTSVIRQPKVPDHRTSENVPTLRVKGTGVKAGTSDRTFMVTSAKNCTDFYLYSGIVFPEMNFTQTASDDDFEDLRLGIHGDKL
jgi:hypothetical protein